MARVFGWGIAVIVLLVGAGFAYRARVQHAAAARLAIHTPNGIDEGGFLEIGGVQQWVQIRGEDRNNPVLLMLHGGPGMSYVPFTSYFRAWEKHFTIVQWDRRGVGRTFGRNGPQTGPMTFDTLASDGIALAMLLRQRLHKEKLILLGHSVGSVVGALMVKRNPDLFYAYVGTDQVVDGASNESVSYQHLQERAGAVRDAKLKAEIGKLSAPPYHRADDWFAKQRLISATDPVSRSFENQLFRHIFMAPHFTMMDMKALGAGLRHSAGALLGDLMTFDLRTRGLAYQLPMFIFEGENDVLDPTELAVAWYGTIQSPDKQLVVFKGAGHNAMLMRNDEFLKELLNRVRPLALPGAAR